MKEETPVLINLLAIQHYDQSPDFPIQFMTMGKLQTLREGEMVLRYQEAEPADEDGPGSVADITLRMTPRRVTMERKGDYHNTMVFAPGQRFEGFYGTPFGEMPMAVISREVESHFRDGRGAIHLKYDMEIHGALASTNELHLEFVKETKTAKEQKENEKADQ